MPVRADDLPKDWQLVRTCLAKAGFVYGEHWRVIASIEWVSGDFDKLNAAYKRCREQVMKEMAAEASESKKK